MLRWRTGGGIKDPSMLHDIWDCYLSACLCVKAWISFCFVDPILLYILCCHLHRAATLTCGSSWTRWEKSVCWSGCSRRGQQNQSVLSVWLEQQVRSLCLRLLQTAVYQMGPEPESTPAEKTQKGPLNKPVFTVRQESFSNKVCKNHVVQGYWLWLPLVTEKTQRFSGVICFFKNSKFSALSGVK